MDVALRPPLEVRVVAVRVVSPRRCNRRVQRLVLEEWESSEAWWEYVESVGEEWNIHAGITADNKVDWDDTIWVLSDAPQAGRAAP